MRLLDQGRQWPTGKSGVTTHHVLRYEYAAQMAKGRTLDAACGVGYGSQILSEKVPAVVGVDASHEAIEWAKFYFPGPKYICATIEEEAWDGEYETVVSIETIEHLKDPTKALQAFRRACIGTFIASVPNEERYPFKAEVFANDWSPHFRHYTPAQFEELLESAGFNVIDRATQENKNHPWIKSGTDGMFLVYICE